LCRQTFMSSFMMVHHFLHTVEIFKSSLSIARLCEFFSKFLYPLLAVQVHSTPTENTAAFRISVISCHVTHSGCTVVHRQRPVMDPTYWFIRFLERSNLPPCYGASTHYVVRRYKISKGSTEAFL